ncbi:MAG: PAS domain S-box protein [Spirochaetes bacterium]|nr:PAS domain S-box protein [Spirochaetota bacterium]
MEPSHMSATGKTLLLVEDELLVAQAESKQLAKFGYRVITASSGREAIEKVRSGAERVDLILMDIDLGCGMDGTEAAREILGDRDIPVVFLSSHTEPEIVERTEKITSYGYVVKNTGITVLDASIKMAFKLFEAHRHIREKNRELDEAIGKLEQTNRELLAREAMLRESEHKYRLMADNSSDTIWMMRFDGTFTYHSPAVMRLRGYAPEEANAIPLEKTLTPKSMALVRRMIEEEFAKPRGEAWAERYAELEMYRKDGSTIWTEVSVQSVRNGEGDVVGFQGSTRDITGRKRTEAQREAALQALRESEARYRLLAENSEDVIWTVDTDWRFTYISPSVRRLLGMEPEEAMKVAVSETLTPESLNTVMEVYRRHLPDIERGLDPTERMEVEQFRKDGSTVWVELSVRVIRDEAGSLAGLIGVSRDITGRRREEGRLRDELARLCREREAGVAPNPGGKGGGA